MRLACLFLVAAAFCGVAPRDDALVVEWDVRWIGRDVLQRNREIHRRERITLAPNQLLRIDDLTFGTTWIVRGDKEIVRVIDPFRGEYSEFTFEQIRARQDEIAAELEEAAARVPGTNDEKEIRRILEGMGRHAEKPEVERKDTGRKQNILGEGCREQTVVVNGEIHLATVFVDGRHKEAAAFFGLLARMGGFHPAVAEEMKNLDGFPVRGILRYLFFGDRVTARVEAVSIGRREWKEDLFELPRGLKKVPLAGFDALPERKVEKPTNLRSNFEEDELERKRRGLESEKDKKEKP